MNFKKNVVFFIILICILLSISGVMASDVNDTDITTHENQVLGEVNDDLIVNSQEDLIRDSGDDLLSSSQDDNLSASSKGTFTDLQILIYLADEGSVINLDKDYVYDENFNFGKGMLILKNLTINGNGHTLDGLSKSRIFFITSGLFENNNVILKNINFKNGKTDLYGGAIFNLADLTIDKCTFSNNYAGTTAGAVCSLGSLNCKNSKFTKNSADGDAGAIFSLNIVNLAQYLGNMSVVDESAIILYILNLVNTGTSSTDYITNCKFTKNVATGRGGGAVYAYTNIKIKSSTFDSNKAGQMGGAVYAAQDLRIYDSKFTSNQVSKYGGAVYFKCHDLGGYYDDNGIWHTEVTFYSCLIKNSVFTQNVAKQRGGAIYGFKYSEMPNKPGATTKECTFSDNKAPKGKNIYGGKATDCVIKDSKITLNNVKVKKSAKSLTLTATLKQSSKALSGKQITFTFNGVTYKAKTNSKGIAKVTIKSNVLKKLKVGSKVKYSAKYGTVSASRTVKVYK